MVYFLLNLWCALELAACASSLGAKCFVWVRMKRTAAPRIFASLDVPVRPHPAAGLVGRQVANASFLEALFRYSDFDAYHFFPGDSHDRTVFEREQEPLWNSLGIADRVKCFSRFELPRQLSETAYRVLHQGDFLTCLASLGQLRSRYAKERFPVTGPIHSISYPSYVESYIRLLLPGLTSYDAIICTSRAGEQALRAGLEQAARVPPLDTLGLVPRMRLARIPLGVDIDRFRPATPDVRLHARDQLELPADGLILLCMGRFSESDKYDLVPLLQVFQSLRRARQSGEKEVLERAHLVLAGARQGSNYPERLRDLTEQMGIEAQVSILVDLPMDRQRLLYQAADVFVSPSDNIQETFGLTVVEALASGLPAVVSDWDGYRDLVVHGESGILVPTYAGGFDGLLGELGPIAYQRSWHLAVAQATVVDMTVLEEGLRFLLLNPLARLKMGLEARLRAEQFSWKRVIEQYLDLWETLKEEALRDVSPPPPPSPLGPPPYQLFAGHPTRSLPLDSELEVTERGLTLLRTPDAHPWYHELDPLFESTILRHVCARLRLGGRLGEVVREAAETYGYPQELVLYQAHWLLKLGFLKLKPFEG